MMRETEQSGQKSLKPIYWILVLMVLAITINYIHRSALSVAAAVPGFLDQMRLGDARLGILFSAFFWTYASLQVVSGYFIDRFGVVPVLASGFLIWCLATAFAGFADGFAVLLAARLLLGAGQSVAYPSFAKILASGFPEHKRGTANALIDAGSRTGPALAVLIGGTLAARFGWRLMFVVLGIGGLLWLVGWLRIASYVPSGGRGRQTGSPTLLNIVGKRQAWGTFLGLFCLNYTWYFVLSWLPSYLVREHHYTPAMMAVYGALPFWGVAAACALFGWVSDRLIVAGARPTRVRIGFVSGGLLLSTLMLPACLVEDRTVSMVLLVAGCLSLGVTSSNMGAITQTLAGTAAVARWTGLQNGMGNLAGIAGTIVSGVLVERAGGFFPAFLVACIFSITGACSYLFVVRRVEPVEW